MTHTPIPPKTSLSEFDLLNILSEHLSSSLELETTMSQLFETLNTALSLKKGVVSFLSPKNDESTIECVFGFSKKERSGSGFSNWVSLNRKVITSGTPIVTDTLDVTQFHFNPDDTPITFFCFPLKNGASILGSISAFIRCETPESKKMCEKVLRLLSLMLAQEVKLSFLVESEKEALRNENILLKQELKNRYNIDNMIGNSHAMQSVYESIIQVASSNATVSIRGESGTGKELVAHAIHYNSTKADGPFIKINCGAIPENLVESELFGHEKGAFTDAQSLKTGKFEAAHNGTIFLDEIAELSPMMQVKLLRVLQDKEIVRIGGISPIKIDVRVITATNRNLEAELEKGKFREDLYYRLNVFPIYLPPLRERKTDILLLAEHFLDFYAKENKKTVKRISSLAIDLLNMYHWPGNVRELENCMERAVIICKGDTIQAQDLPPTLQSADVSLPIDLSDHVSLQDVVNNFERELIIDALKKSKGNKSRTAKLLNTTQRIIGYKIKALNINYTKYKS